jgi:hypothetical protein
VTTLAQIPGMKDPRVMVQTIRELFIAPNTPKIEDGSIQSSRREVMAARLALYRDDFKTAVTQIIEKIWTDNTVKKDRKRLLDLVGFLNVPKRITDEVASLYDVPAKRTFNTERQTAAFQKVEKELQLNAVMKEAHRLSFWLNNVLLWLHEDAEDDNKRSLRIVTPDAFDVIVHPRNPLKMVAVILDCAPAWVPMSIEDRRKLPHYEVWDSEVRFSLDADGYQIGEIEKHEKGRIPAVLLSARLPVDRLIDVRPGSDIDSAAKAVLFLNVLTLSLSQTSGEQQPYLQGNLSEMAKDQPQSAGRPIALPPGVTAGVLDLVTNPEHLLVVIRHVLASVAQAYGMSYEQFTFQETADTASGKAYTVRRQKLTELRVEQRGRAEVHEPEVATLIFGTSEGLHVDYHDQAAPMDPLEDHELFVERMNRGLDNPLAKMARENPDATAEQLMKKLLTNVGISSWFFSLLRAANLSSDATVANPGQTPEENGADGGKAKAEGERPDEDKAATPSDDPYAWVKEVADAA